MSSLRELTADELEAVALASRESPAARAAFAARLWTELEARSAQLPPAGDWHTWLLIGGRGSGKTTAVAKNVAQRVRDGVSRRIALIERTPADARETMIEGDDGILAASAAIGIRPLYEPAKKRITWPRLGAGAPPRARIFTAAHPDEVRGFNSDLVWGEELCAWRAPETWENAMLGLRLGLAQAIGSTTPKPGPLLKAIKAAPATVVTKMRTLDNAANLAPAFVRYVVEPLLGTRLGRQELEAEELADAAGALWRREQIERNRIRRAELPELAEIVVAIDPATTSEPGSDETGLVAAGRTAGRALERRGYLLGDWSGRHKPERWAALAVAAYHELEADCIVAEANNGGDLVRSVIANVDPSIRVRLVYASRGKQRRAEPVAQLCELDRVSHVGVFPELEDQLCLWEPGVSSGYSPDRLDAYVWALSHLIPTTSGFTAADAIAAMEEERRA